MLAPDPIDIRHSDDEPLETWISAEWIGTGKRYPSKDPPHFIQNAFRNLLAIPSQYYTLIPSPTMSVDNLLIQNLP